MTTRLIDSVDLSPYQDTTILTTITNYGYLLYTLNMLKSLAPFGLDRRVLILTMDQKSEHILRRRGYQVVPMKGDSLERFCPWNTKGYDRICYIKLEWIHCLLSHGKNVLLIDGDIVFRKNPAEDLQRWEADSLTDIWIQNDGHSDSEHGNMCTGYMYLRSSPTTISLYDCVSAEGQEKYKQCAFVNNDQTYFNQFVKPYCQMKALPLIQYPNGAIFYHFTTKLSPVLVHFNWVVGHMKMAKMKEHQMWLLEPAEEDV